MLRLWLVGKESSHHWRIIDRRKEAAFEDGDSCFVDFSDFISVYVRVHCSDHFSLF